MLHEHPAIKNATVPGVRYDVVGNDIAAAVFLRLDASGTAGWAALEGPDPAAFLVCFPASRPAGNAFCSATRYYF